MLEAICPLDLTIALWMGGRGIANLKANSARKLFKLLCCELSTIVSDDLVWGTEPSDYFGHELDGLFCRNLTDWLCFNPFRELVHCYEKVSKTPLSFHERSDNV